MSGYAIARDWPDRPALGRTSMRAGKFSSSTVTAYAGRATAGMSAAGRAHLGNEMHLALNPASGVPRLVGPRVSGCDAEPDAHRARF
jgi:hypothetical protein